MMRITADGTPRMTRSAGRNPARGTGHAVQPCGHHLVDPAARLAYQLRHPGQVLHERPARLLKVIPVEAAGEALSALWGHESRMHWILPAGLLVRVGRVAGLGLWVRLLTA